MRGLVIPVAAGVLGGAATEVAIAAGPLRLLTVFAGIWVLGAAWIGRRSDDPRAAALRSALFLAAMVCAFYLTVLAVESQFRVQLWVFWLLVSFTGGPLLGLAGHWTNREGIWSGLAAAGIAGLLAAEGLGVSLGFGGHGRVVFGAFDLVGALLVLSWPRRRARWTAMAVFVPALFAGAIVFAAIPLLVYGDGPPSGHWHGGGRPPWSHHHL